MNRNVAGLIGVVAVNGVSLLLAPNPWVPAASLLGVGIVAAVNYVVDPYQRYRRPERTYYSRPRYLNSGLIRSHDYDSVVLGSSLINDLRPSFVEQEVGGICLKLPVRRGSALEMGVVLGAILDGGKARRIILCFDPFMCRGELDRLPYGRKAMPVHLYRDGLLSDIRYLVDLDTLYRSWRIRRSRVDRKGTHKLDRDAYGFTATKNEFSKEEVCGKWKKGLPERVPDPAAHRFERLRRNFDRHIAPRILGEPGVEFWLYYPPYSVLAWIDDAKRGVMEDSLDLKDHAFETLGGLEHVRFFDFHAHAGIPVDLSEYKDVTHYSPAVNERIVRMMAAGEARVTPENRAASRRAIEEMSRGPNPCEECDARP